MRQAHSQKQSVALRDEDREGRLWLEEESRTTSNKKQEIHTILLIANKVFAKFWFSGYFCGDFVVLPQVVEWT